MRVASCPDPDSFHLYVDLGNSTLHAALWQEGWRFEGRFEAGRRGGADFWRDGLLEGARQAGLEGTRCAGAMASASSSRVQELEGAVKAAFNTAPRLLGRDISVPMAVLYDDPSSLGRDRALAGFAAWKAIGGACIIVDAGTCVTCDVLTAAGELAPVAIAPGLPALRGGIRELVPHLGPACDAAGPGALRSLKLPAPSTRASVAAGIAHTLGGAVERLIREARRLLEPAAEAPIIVTGGDAALVAELVTMPVRVEPMLNLDGLRLLDETLKP